MADKKPSNRERIKEIVTGIEAGIQDLFQSDKFEDYLRTMSRFHNYWLTTTQDSVRLAAPKKHQLDMRVAEEYWEVEDAEIGIWPEKYVMVVRPKSMDPGTVAPMAAADTSGEYAVYYFAAYRNGEQLWEIDKRNMKCVILGVDYMADVRKALGKQ